jgi:hypothetical protein
MVDYVRVLFNKIFSPLNCRFVTWNSLLFKYCVVWLKYSNRYHFHSDDNVSTDIDGKLKDYEEMDRQF